MNTLFDSVSMSSLDPFTKCIPILDLIYKLNTSIFAGLNNTSAWWDARPQLVAATDRVVNPLTARVNTHVQYKVNLQNHECNQQGN